MIFQIIMRPDIININRLKIFEVITSHIISQILGLIATLMSYLSNMPRLITILTNIMLRLQIITILKAIKLVPLTININK